MSSLLFTASFVAFKDVKLLFFEELSQQKEGVESLQVWLLSYVKASL